MVEDEREFKLDFNQYHFDKWVKSKVEQIPSGSRVIDIGAGTCPYRNLFKKCKYITQDFLRYDVDSLIELFKTTIPKYLFEFEKKLFSEILTVGYCIEGFKR